MILPQVAKRKKSGGVQSRKLWGGKFPHSCESSQLTVGEAVRGCHLSCHLEDVSATSTHTSGCEDTSTNNATTLVIFQPSTSLSCVSCSKRVLILKYIYLCLKHELIVVVDTICSCSLCVSCSGWLLPICFTAFLAPFLKLDRVGPVNNRTSTNKLHYFVQKKN